MEGSAAVEPPGLSGFREQEDEERRHSWAPGWHYSATESSFCLGQVLQGNDMRPEMVKCFEWSVVAQSGAPHQPQRGGRQ